MLRLAGLLAIAAVALAVIAAVGPDLGLGEREQFIFYRLLGWERRQVATVASLLAIAASVLCALRIILRASPGGAGRGGGPWRWVAANVLPGVATTYLALLVAFAGFEVVLRAQVPFAAQRWPISFDPAVGQIFAPGDTLRWTNGFDFWTETPVNALGMLDRPPPPPDAAPGTCRIAFLGDSFVEAAQVPIAQKVQVVLEEKLNRAASQRGIGLRFEAFAIGRTGTGQAHRLGYHQALVRPYKPDILVAVLVVNDLADNSTPLKSVASGWFPGRFPMTSVDVDAQGRAQLRAIDPDWARHVLAEAPSGDVVQPGVRRQVLRLLTESSVALQRLYELLQIEMPTAVGWLAAAGDDPTARRMPVVAQALGDPRLFDGWRWPRDLQQDQMYFSAQMPPVFDTGLKATAFALGTLQRRSAEDRTHMVLLASYGLAARHERYPDRTLHGRTLVDGLQLERFAAMARELGLPMLDQAAFIAAQGGKVRDAHFERDMHWSAQGHRWTADQVLDYVIERPQLCRAWSGRPATAR